MKVARYAHSMCEVNEGVYIYAFGGQTGEGTVLDTIERVEVLALDSGRESALGAWELVNEIKLQSPLCNIGCYPASKIEVLLFGGLDANM